MTYRFSNEAFPIVEFELGERLTHAEAAAYFEDCDHLVHGGRPYVMVLDGTHMLMPDAVFLRRQVAWMRDHYARLVELNRGIAFVMPSALTRGILRAVNHFEAVPVPYEVFDTLAAARDWAADQAVAQGLGERRTGAFTVRPR